MKRMPVSDMTDEQLVERYLALCEAQEAVLFADHNVSIHSVFSAVDGRATG